MVTKTKPKKVKQTPRPVTIDDFRSESEFGKVPQVAKILNVSRQTVYKLVSDGHLPAIMVSDCVRVLWSEVEKFIERGGSPKIAASATAS